MTDRAAGGAHHVVVVALENVLALDIGIPMQVFGSWRDGPYTLTVCAERPGPVPMHGGPALSVAHGLDALASADTVIVPGYLEPDGLEPDLPGAEVTAALAGAAARGARMASICTGAFALAAAGLLDGRRATTHWLFAQALARRYPQVTVVPEDLYIDEGQVLTSGGVSSGLDLCLHLIRRDHGPRLANQQARLLVAAPHRTGGQAPFIDLPVRPEPSDSPALYDWALRNLHQPLTVDQLALQAGMSRRTLIRRFHTDTGLPPMRWLLDARLARARELLESGDLTVEAVARHCGLGTPANFRTLFKAHVGVPPSVYRETFVG
ncbi:MULTISPECIES: GlxA family transcriptional regulator [unclassified Streptomyces]|uniref:GlxA family transcriptional regulator n=1 Tax=unclassified Streptomyces TaxID=2593676 RepID=UPI002252F406|nr:helix-turn-helix domain-containing protein [Streptomyces sp. NBC_00047]MCX5612629.1 helix-turn-helix domain-containing protein [Streptomyces sp. NBC_00047]